MPTEAITDLAKVFVSDIPAVSWLAILPVVLCLVTGAALAMIRRQIHWHTPVAIGALACLVALDAFLLWHVATQGPMTMVLGRWLPPFGIAFSVDVAGALLALTAAVVALAGSIYALSDIDTNTRRYGFYPFLMFLLAGVSGAFLTGDIFNLYVWFEVLLISSFGLLVLGGEREQIDGAMKYGLLNLVATTLFLIATGYIYAIFGTLNMADIAAKVAADDGSLPLMTLATLYLAAFGMKAAAFPVNFWLPASYHTPRITVSALFAGLLTKVGVYALFRVLVMIMPEQGEALRPLIWAVAILTMLTGSIGAIASSDIRRLLGYWVISGIGVMLAGLAIGGQDALSAAVFYMLHSMVVMAALYFLAGLVGRAAAGFDLHRVWGLYGRFPLLTALAMVLLFAISGLPPFSGFWPKAMLVRTALAQESWLIAATILLSGFLMTFAAGRILLLAFWRPAPDEAEAVSLPGLQICVLTALTCLVVFVGLWPEPLAVVSAQAADGLLNPQTYIRSVFGEPQP
ncbi:Na+/H+ antiporter subunit D [Rhizobium sp. KVB221]|uniref:Na+/H+ antiporter subunit D n=1 Tax=Rhizobium setariae TaxID=2801340 RepID=A0A936YR17_9HYPH|nr:Na+/H+ antiporter subunit D [Rhizobium setariae]MBL0370992.1 Na+/H+ antiporter subunit D [Rhizobium setariae]